VDRGKNGQTDIKKQIVAFRYFAKAPENCLQFKERNILLSSLQELANIPHPERE